MTDAFGCSRNPYSSSMKTCSYAATSVVPRRIKTLCWVLGKGALKMAVDPGMPIVALRTTPLIPKREKCWRNDLATLPRLNRSDIRHHFCFCASSGLFRRLATGINGALPVKGQYNLSYRVRSPGGRRSLDPSARPLARRGHTLHWLSGAKATLSGVTGALTFLPSPLCCLPLRRVRQRTRLCGDVSACGIVALCRRLRGLAGASAPLRQARCAPLRRAATLGACGSRWFGSANGPSHASSCRGSHGRRNATPDR
jgi:hypothetical protein